MPQLVWCAVPGGPFLLGTNATEEAYDDEKPQHELTLPTFYLARYPITNAQFAPFWDAAARRKRVYAWGETWDETRANVAGQIDHPSAVGIFPAGVSACGTLDMTGNVWEWAWSRYESYPYQNDTRHDPAGEARRTLRGGAWNVNARLARASSRNVLAPANFGSNVGLRVAVAPVFGPSGF